jgi:hypothetical protein
LSAETSEKANRVMQALMQIETIDMRKLEEAHAQG